MTQNLVLQGSHACSPGQHVCGDLIHQTAPAHASWSSILVVMTWQASAHNDEENCQCKTSKGALGPGVVYIYISLTDIGFRTWDFGDILRHGWGSSVERTSDV